MFWFRSAKSLADLEIDDSILSERAYLFEMPGGIACFVTRTKSEGPWLECSPPTNDDEETSSDDIMRIDLTDLPDIQAWMHLTYSAKHIPSSGKSEAKSHAYLTVKDITETGPYVPMQDRNVYYGTAMDKSSQGFPGDYRQFYFTLGYVEKA